MPFGMKRSDLQKIAEAKIGDATLLLREGRSSNAYYLAGYAVEVGLKACIARLISPKTIPDRAILKNVLNHNFITLAGLAGLATELKSKQESDREFASYWATVSEWSPDIRYETVEVATARLMIQAVSHPGSGVLPWIKTYW